MLSLNLNELSKQIHQNNVEVGWWDDPDRCLYQTLQLISSELSEAMEGDRKNLYDDHLPERKMVEVEMADAFIRLLDFGGKMKLNYYYDKIIYNSMVISSNIKTFAGKLLGLNQCLVKMAEHLYDDKNEVENYYNQFISSLLWLCDWYEKEELNVIDALYEKLEYNKNRADHKRENRMTENGKKY